MLRLAITFFVISVIAAVFGFGGIAAATSEIAVFMFWLFFVVFLITLFFGLLGIKKPVI